MVEFIKMNTLLAKVDHSNASVAKLFSDYAQFFKNKQGMFRGSKKTFVPRDGYVDHRTMGTTVVATTVDEKMDWFNEQFKNWLNDVFRVEATNSKGAKTVELIVDGKSFGNLTALELMRLKSILTNKDLEAVFANIPVRSDSEVWTPTQDPEYNGREVFETALIKGVTRTTEKEEVILKDLTSILLIFLQTIKQRQPSRVRLLKLVIILPRVSQVNGLSVSVQNFSVGVQPFLLLSLRLLR